MEERKLTIQEHIDLWEREISQGVDRRPRGEMSILFALVIGSVMVFFVLLCGVIGLAMGLHV